MTLWLLLTALLLTISTVAALAWPMRSARLPDSRAIRLNIFRNQLAELERDVERGLVTSGEGDAARREIERRLLRAASSTPSTLIVSWIGRLSGSIVLVLVPALAATVYINLGSPKLPDQPIAERQAGGGAAKPDIAAMVARLEARLASDPNDVQGWLMLAQSKAVLGDADASVEAWRQALERQPRDPRALSGLAESLVVNARGIVTPEAHALFEQLAAQAPADPRASYYLGLAAYQAGDARAAVARFEALLAASSADAPWRERVVEALRLAADEAGMDAAAILGRVPGRTAPPAPAALPASEEAARITSMPLEERARAIRSMVDDLQARLEAGGGDAEGWRRLGMARRMLGELEAAQRALSKAATLAPDDPTILAQYAEASLGEPDPHSGLPQIGDEAWRLFERLALLAPDDPGPWWYLGIRALQDGRVAEARSNWRRVLTLLPGDHPDHAAIAERLAAIGG